MKPFTWYTTPNSLSATLCFALPVGLATALLVQVVNISSDPTVVAIATLLSGHGNDAFLVLTNFLIFGWAWRNRLRSLIPLTLSLDFLVWVSVQGTKRLAFAPWALRPNGLAGGFPSGHACHAFAMAVLLTFIFPRFGWFWYLCAAAISWSRLEVYAHTSFQIVAGIILGIGIGWIMVARWLKHPEAIGFVPPTISLRNNVVAATQPYPADKVS